MFPFHLARRDHAVGRTSFQVCLLLLVISGFDAATAQEKNSTRKIRVKPNELSAKVGTAVRWEKSIDAALAKSRSSGKPVFWYVSTVPGTFMDRKPEIDRYMLGGPFSWQPIIKLLNENFVPVRIVPDGELAQEFDLVPYKFVEPGFLVVDKNRKSILRVDRVTTLHYPWLRTLLEMVLRREGARPTVEKAPGYFSAFAGTPENWVDPFGEKHEKNAANLLLSGMIAFRKGDHDLARERWIAAAKAEPDSPLAWKAALEAQGLGPFYRGFETFRSVKSSALTAGIRSVGSAAPPNTYSISEMIDRSVEFLLGMQRNDGAFVDSDYDFGGTDSLPNVHVAVTSLVGMALLQAPTQDNPRAPRIDQALRKIIRFVSADENVNPADRDEILWAHSFRLRLLARALRSNRFVDLTDELKVEIQQAIKDLENIQLKTGNWYHEYSNPFVAATALCALHEGKLAGGDVDMQKIEKGLEALQRDRIANGAYPYFSSPRRRQLDAAAQRRLLKASAGRMPICELALVRWGRKKQPELTFAVANSLENHSYLATAYKYDNHTSRLAYGGFFFWYDMRGRSEAIRAIENQPQRKKFMQQQLALINTLPELDGCFVDSHELGRCYGTAMALLSMQD